MRRSILLVICTVALLAGSASAQQPGYYPQNSVPLVDMGNGYRLQVGSPYYRPASASAIYYTPGYSPAFYRWVAYPSMGPNTMPSNPQIYYVAPYQGYYRPYR
jgi:hypothetical protein